MYQENIIHHLPKIDLVKFGPKRELPFTFRDCVIEFECWYKCAAAGVKYDLSWLSDDIRSSSVRAPTAY